jgi:tRNA pseudouridine32 synthase/23S rRNA pseudouridine746 synthase
MASELNQYTYHVPPPCDEDIEIIFVDDDLLVVVKPAGLLSVPGRVVKDCVLNRLRADYPEVVIVHRLDLDTSGLLLLSRSRLATSDLNRQFRERLVFKQYVAMVDGVVEKDKGEVKLSIAPDANNRPRQMIDDENGKPGHTCYEVVERMKDRTRLLLIPITGRSHQLRIHMAEIGHPILGCDLYAHSQALRAADRLLLHAYGLQFQHPSSKDQLEFSSQAPF